MELREQMTSNDHGTNVSQSQTSLVKLPLQVSDVVSSLYVLQFSAPQVLVGASW